MFETLNHLGLSQSMPAVRRTIDRLRQDYDVNVMKWKEEVESHLAEDVKEMEGELGYQYYRY